MGYNYLLRQGDSAYYKIGHTNNIKKRIEQLQTGCPIVLNLLFYAEVSDSKDSETKLHEKFWDKRFNGEWFCLEDSDVALVTDPKHWCAESGFLESYSRMGPIARSSIVPANYWRKNV